MAEHPLRRGSADQDQKESLLRQEPEREQRWEQAEERRVSRAMGFTDLIAVLMVIATGFSAFATWRTAQVTSQVFAIAARPFPGGYRNWSSKRLIHATHTGRWCTRTRTNPAGRWFGSVDAWIDGKLVPDPFPGAMDMYETGGIPPDEDHFFYRYFTVDSYKDAASGKSRLLVEVRIDYKGLAPHTQYCNFKRFVFDYRTATFRHAGGSNKCTGSQVF
jgi:hypothetical protein